MGRFTSHGTNAGQRERGPMHVSLVLKNTIHATRQWPVELLRRHLSWQPCDCRFYHHPSEPKIPVLWEDKVTISLIVCDCRDHVGWRTYNSETMGGQTVDCFMDMPKRSIITWRQTSVTQHTVAIATLTDFVAWQ